MGIGYTGVGGLESKWGIPGEPGMSSYRKQLLPWAGRIRGRSVAFLNPGAWRKILPGLDLSAEQIPCCWHWGPPGAGPVGALWPPSWPSESESTD